MVTQPFRATSDWLTTAARLWKEKPVCTICGEMLRAGDLVRWRPHWFGKDHFPSRLQVQHVACEEEGGRSVLMGKKGLLRRLERAASTQAFWVMVMWLAVTIAIASTAFVLWLLLFDNRPTTVNGLVPDPVEKTAAEVVAEVPIVPPYEDTVVGKPMLFETSAYTQSVAEGTADGITASGLPVARGMCAADPALIPPGTVLLVDGYGYCVVGDVGAAIVGARLDLFFQEREEAMAWGRRRVMARTIDFRTGNIW